MGPHADSQADRTLEVAVPAAVDPPRPDLAAQEEVLARTGGRSVPPPPPLPLACPALDQGRSSLKLSSVLLALYDIVMQGARHEQSAPQCHRRTSYVDQLKEGVKHINNPADAHKLFRQLMKNKETPEYLALTFDHKLQPALRTAIMVLEPDISETIELISALAVEKLSYGAFKSRVLLWFQAIFETPGFIDEVLVQSNADTLHDPAAVAWFLVKLAQDVNTRTLVRDDPAVVQIVNQLQVNNAAGASELATLFASTATNDSAAEPTNTDQQFVYLHEAKSVMRPPGTREHDNDPQDFREIQIVPTTAELACGEQPYLPPVDGSEFIENKEAALLDRHFRLLREDMLGPVREELIEESKRVPSEHRRLYARPIMVRIGVQPRPQIVLRVSMTARLNGRTSKMTVQAAKDFFDSGPGRRVFGTDSLVIMAKKTGKRLIPTGVGVVVARRDIVCIEKGRVGRHLEVGVHFASESMSNVVTSLKGLAFRKHGVQVADYLYNASASFFTYEPVLQSLQEMTNVPFADVLVHLRSPPPLQLAHAQYSVATLSKSLQAAVQSDPSQRDALQLALDSPVVLVQGPPGTGKTYIGVQMVKAMLEAEKRNFGPKKLQILCLRQGFTNIF